MLANSYVNNNSDSVQENILCRMAESAKELVCVETKITNKFRLINYLNEFLTAIEKYLYVCFNVYTQNLNISRCFQIISLHLYIFHFIRTFEIKSHITNSIWLLIDVLCKMSRFATINFCDWTCDRFFLKFGTKPIPYLQILLSSVLSFRKM